jgi:hypothetical protein
MLIEVHVVEFLRIGVFPQCGRLRCYGSFQHGGNSMAIESRTAGFQRPTPAEIKRVCEAIQAEWTAAEREKRCVYKPQRVTVYKCSQHGEVVDRDDRGGL